MDLDLIPIILLLAFQQVFNNSLFVTIEWLLSLGGVLLIPLKISVRWTYPLSK